MALLAFRCTADFTVFVSGAHALRVLLAILSQVGFLKPILDRIKVVFLRNFLLLPASYQLDHRYI